MIAKQVFRIATLCIISLWAVLTAYTAQAQSWPDNRWYFGNSSNWIDFSQGTGQLANGQSTPYGTAGSVVATNPRTGELLFYSDGVKLVGADGSVVSEDLGGDNTLSQPVQALPQEGSQDTYFIVVLDENREFNFYTYNVTTQQIIDGPTLIPVNSGTPTGVMELVRTTFGTTTTYQILFPVIGSENSSNISVLGLAGGIPSEVGRNILPTSSTEYSPQTAITSLAFNPQNNYLVVGQDRSDSGEPLSLYELNGGNYEFVDTLGVFTSKPGAINSLAWKGETLFAARSSTVDSGTGIWQITYNALELELSANAIVENSTGIYHLDLRTGPDGRVYHLYKPTTNSNAELVGYVQSPTSDNATLVREHFNNTDFNSRRFSRAAALPSIPIPSNVLFSNTCAEGPLYLYPQLDESYGLPDSVEWLTDQGVVSTKMLPALTAPGQEGNADITFKAYYPEGISETQVQVPVNAKIDLQLTARINGGEEEPVEQEIILCAGDDAEVKLVAQDSEGTDITSQGSFFWYKPQSVELRGKQRITTNENEIVIEAITAQDPDTGEDFYAEAGTYYLVFNQPGGCETYKAFKVVVYNEGNTRQNLWYFGDGAGVDFASGTPVPTPAGDNQMIGSNKAIEGTTIAVDENIYPLFYTNGVRLWVQDFNDDGEDDLASLTKNGDDVLGGSKDVAQNSILKQVASDPTLYYLLTISNEGDGRKLYYNIADLKGNSSDPNGEIASDLELAFNSSGADVPVRKIFFGENVSEKLAANEKLRQGGWLVTHELGSNRFISFEVAADGLGTAKFSSAGAVHNNSGGYMVFSPDGNRLAAVIPGNGVEIYHFDSETGMVKDSAVVSITADRLPGSNADQLYGIGFQSDGILAISQVNPGKLYAIAISDTLTQEEMISSIKAVELDGESGRLGAIQRGPDRKLYVSNVDTDRLGSIELSVDSETLKFTIAKYNSSAVTGLAGQGQLGLPNLVEPSNNSINNPTISVTSGCIGDPVTLKGTRRYDNEQYIFLVFDENGDIIYNQSKTPQDADSVVIKAIDHPWVSEPGKYTAELRLFACDLTYPESSPIYDNEEDIIEEFFISPQPEAALKTADGEVIQPENPDTSPNVYRLEVCNGEQYTITAEALLEGANDLFNAEDFFYVWELAGAVSFPPSPVLENASAGDYILTLTNLETQCERLVYLFIQNKGPEVDFINPDDAFCRADGTNETNAPSEISFGITNESTPDPGRYEVLWTLSVNGSEFNEVEDPDINTKFTLETDTLTNSSVIGQFVFAVKVTDISDDEDCFNTDTLTYNLGIPPKAELEANGLTCADDASVTLTATITRYRNTQPGASYTYIWYQNGTIVQSGPNANYVVPNTEDGSTNGEYYVVAVDNLTSCESDASNTIDINFEDVLTDIRIDPDGSLCGDAPFFTLQAKVAYGGIGRLTYQWFRKNEDGSETPVPQDAVPSEIKVSEGTYFVTVTLENDSECGNQSATSEDYTVKPVPDGVLSPPYTLCPTSEEPSLRVTVIKPNLPSNFDSDQYDFEWRDANDMIVGKGDSLVTFSPGNYTLRIDDCPVTEFEVIEDCTPQLLFPNVFRPGSNVNVNSYFHIVNKGIINDIKDGSFEIIIYNRWGEAIYQSFAPNFEWRGTNKNSGQEVMTGTYAYVVRYQNRTGSDTEKVRVQRGGVTLLR
jgi:hypothetical protein